MDLTNRTTKGKRRKQSTSAMMRDSLRGESFKSPMAWSVGGNW